jgi:hypothetical protein
MFRRRALADPPPLPEDNAALKERRRQKKQEFDALVAENISLRTRLGMNGSNKELEALLRLEKNPDRTRVELSNKRMQVFRALTRENQELNEALEKKGRGFSVGNAKRALFGLGAAGLAAGLGRAYLEPRELVQATPSLAQPFGSYAGSTLYAAPAPFTFSTMLPSGGLEQVRAEAQAARKLMPTPTETPPPPPPPPPPAPPARGKGIIHGLLYGKLQGGRNGTKRRRMSKRRRSTARRR